jgi:hypothetical protein
MKKLILAVAIISSLASCKKELECICEGGSIITNYKVYNLKETEKKAKEFCDKKDAEIKNTFC